MFLSCFQKKQFQTKMQIFIQKIRHCTIIEKHRQKDLSAIRAPTQGVMGTGKLLIIRVIRNGGCHSARVPVVLDSIGSCKTFSRCSKVIENDHWHCCVQETTELETKIRKSTTEMSQQAMKLLQNSFISFHVAAFANLFSNTFDTRHAASFSKTFLVHTHPARCQEASVLLARGTGKLNKITTHRWHHHCVQHAIKTTK